MSAPFVETARLRLRPFDIETDLDPIAAALANPAVVEYLPGSEPRDRERTRQILEAASGHWEKYGFGFWALTDRLQGVVMGWCGLNGLQDAGEVELLYLLDEPYWGRGFATEAGRASVRYGFDHLEEDHFVGLVHHYNTGSRRVLEKIGFCHRGRETHFHMDVDGLTISRESFEVDESAYSVSKGAG